MRELGELLAEAKSSYVLPTENEKQYECPKCKDTGWVEVKSKKKGYIFMKRCECQSVKEAEQLMKHSGISEEFRSKNFSNFDTRNIDQLSVAKTKAVNYCKSFEKTEHTRNNSIMFCGQVGSGKTHLGTAICNSLMNRNVAVIYMAYRNAMTKLKQIMTDESQYDKERNKYLTARVLYIDDLLKGKITESDVNIMYEIINYRYMNNLPIIISTEKSLDELLDFDEATGSRIIEMCRGNTVSLQGKELNYRLYS